jgi:hypothetical protein
MVPASGPGAEVLEFLKLQPANPRRISHHIQAVEMVSYALQDMDDSIME